MTTPRALHGRTLELVIGHNIMGVEILSSIRGQQDKKSMRDLLKVCIDLKGMLYMRLLQ